MKSIEDIIASKRVLIGRKSFDGGQTMAELNEEIKKAYEMAGESYE